MRIELERWFASLSPDGAPRLERLAEHERSTCRRPSWSAGGASSPTPTRAVARAAWERVPFREVPYAEDRVLAIDMLRAGYAKAFVPEAAVIHSHAYTPVAAAAPLLRRVARAARGLRLARAGLARAPARAAARRARAGAARLVAQGASPARRRATLAAVAGHHVVCRAGALLGSRADRLPAAATRRLSLERRAGFAPLDLDDEPMPPTKTDSPR